MARLDYYAIEVAIKTILDATLLATTVLIEEVVAYIEGPLVVIYLDRRRAPAELQQLSAGTSTRFELDLTLWCLALSYDGVREASQLRDNIIGQVEVAMMADRTIGGTVMSSWIEGGEFRNSRTEDDSGFISAGEVKIIASARSSTT